MVPCRRPGQASAPVSSTPCTLAPAERDFFIDNLPVRIHFIIVMIRWTGLAPWEFEFPFPGSLTSTFLERLAHLHLQRFRGGLVFKAHRLCVSLNSRLESNKEEESTCMCVSHLSKALPFIEKHCHFIEKHCRLSKALTFIKSNALYRKALPLSGKRSHVSKNNSHASKARPFTDTHCHLPESTAICRNSAPKMALNPKP